MKLIEAWGSGIQKMKKELEAYPEIALVLQEAGHAFQMQFVKKEMTGAESQREILSDKILWVLMAGPLSKTEISQKFGQKEISGQLNTIIQNLRKEDQIE